MSSFIESQFPIARLSAESYKERKAVAGQTLTGLGKWWGRKPLILVRASILGMLMPASEDPKKDRDIFLKILTMDDGGAWLRCKGTIPPSAWREAASSQFKEEYFSNSGFKKGLTAEEKEEICEQIWDSLSPDERSKLIESKVRPSKIRERAAFDALPYDERIEFCERPENVEGPSTEAWYEINDHLGTTASSISELVQQLGQKTFGHTPRVGDSFCGGGSIPFEAARIGCAAYGSDLNPVAGLLSWAGLNLLGGGDGILAKVREAQEAMFVDTDRQIIEWGIEHNECGERAEAYLYCVEVKPEGCNYYIPLAPSWVISEKYRIVCTWHRVSGSDRLQSQVIEVSSSELVEYKNKKDATAVDGRVIDPFDRGRSWSIESLRGPDGLRRWKNEDLIPRPDDVFQERLYCIRWTKVIKVENSSGKQVDKTIRRYAAPAESDLMREARVLELLHERFHEWQREGFIPSKAMPEDGDKTDEPIRTRGWTCWHHLFTPRQLLVNGLFSKNIRRGDISTAVGLLLVGRIANNNARLTRWKSSGSQTIDVFSNQALNTLVNFASRGTETMKSLFLPLHLQKINLTESKILLADAREINHLCDYWITDPPYADAVNYHELGDFFLAWYDKQLQKAFSNWIPDARSELAVRGSGEDFRHSMVEIYKNLAAHMPNNGMQLVMFTHQDPAVWADLGMILWAAGLRATAAWTISTETEAAGIKKGNYVQGTVCLVLRKRLGSEAGFLDEVYPLVEDEVRRQIASMQALDDGGEPNFNDADYQLAAYAAALKVLTQYGSLDGRDVEHEVFAVRDPDTKSDFQIVIERALGIACDTLIPKGLDTVWRELSLVERYYVRGLDIESRGERRQGMYEELARGFGVTEIRPLLKSDKANGARMHTPSGFGTTGLISLGNGINSTTSPTPRRGRGASIGTHPFASSSLRHLLFAIRETAASDNDPELGRQYLRDTFGQSYWQKREWLISLLNWLALLGGTEGMEEWSEDSVAARILAGRLRNDEA